MLAGSAGLIDATYRLGGSRGDTPRIRISELLRPLTHAAVVAMQTAGHRDYERLYLRSLASNIEEGLTAAAESAFDAAESIRAIELTEPSAILSPPPARRPGIRGRSGAIGGAGG
ncbi:MAG: hypothetical protein ACRD3Q_17935, partial [Terriglobales bacterium]